MTDNQVRVGTGVIVLNDKNQFLMGCRRNSHGEGTWGLVGGHVDFGETLEECAYREVLEETGLEIGDIEIISTATQFFDNKTKHYIAVFMIARIKGGVLEVKEPHKIDSWEFFDDWDSLPQPLFVDYASQVNFKKVTEYISNR